MSLIQKVADLGYSIQNKKCYLWEIQKWLREVHGIAVIIDTDETLSWYWKIYSLHPLASWQGSKVSNCVWNDKYESALEDGLEEALKLI